jgi:hypothetical protein
MTGLHVVSPRANDGLGPALAGAAREIALAAAVVVAIAAASALLLLLAVLVMPAAAALVGWAIWRSACAARPPMARLRARWGRSARVLPGGGSR